MNMHGRDNRSRKARAVPCVFVLALCLCTDRAAGQRDLRIESAGNRFALAIGNNAYRRGVLKNAANDARGVAIALRDVGFAVDVVTDASLARMEEAVDRFVALLKPGDVAVFYYAGHGVQVDGENYLIPTDFNGKDETDIKFGSRSASWIQEKLDRTGAQLKILILDACRTNPFRIKRSLEGGLAQMQGGRGSFIAFATAAGKVADDNPASGHGLFTQHLIETLHEPGLTLDGVFNQVRTAVDRDSGHEQLPYIYSGVIGEFYFRPPAAGAVSASRPTTGDPELVYWNSVKDSRNAALFESYLKRYPKGQFAEVARLKIDAMHGTTPQTPAQPTPPEVRVNPVDGQRYLRIQPGSFRMGCSTGDSECRQDEMPPHQVTISKGFWLGETEVMDLAYEKFSHDTGSRMPGDPAEHNQFLDDDERDCQVNFRDYGYQSSSQCPHMPRMDFAGRNKKRAIAWLTWAEAVSYCKWAGGRLPSEAEWEFAARGGTSSARYGPLQEIAVVMGSQSDGTVGLKLPNAFGLHDMLGSVAEWTADWYAADYYRQSPAVDPKGPEGGEKLVVRGGSAWSRGTAMLRVSARGYAPPGYLDISVGFRCVWMPDR
jgi:formylglycine-generating enzyme required for sulfatase activity